MKFSILSALLASALILATSSVALANTVVWESAKSLIDTTDYTGLAPYYWFANFNNPTANSFPAVGTTDASEARNLPNWLHLETRHAFIGKDDSGVNNDTTFRTGYSFVENGNNTAGGGTVGGLPNTFNRLTLPDGLSGVSGQVLELQQGLNNTTTQLAIRVLDGAPESFRIWVVTDNGSGTSFNVQNRIRVGLRNTVGPPTFEGGDTLQVEDEALPGGFRLGGQGGSIPAATNGTADAWSFLLSSVEENDLVTIRPTGGAGFTNYAGFAGLIIQPIPEPGTATMFGIALAGCGFIRRSRRS